MSCVLCRQVYSAAKATQLPKQLPCGHTYCSGCVSGLGAKRGGACPVDGSTVVPGAGESLPTNAPMLQSALTAQGKPLANVLFCPFHGVDLSRHAVFASVSDGYGVCVDCATRRQMEGTVQGLIPLDACPTKLQGMLGGVTRAVERGVAALREQQSKLETAEGLYVKGLARVAAEVDTFFADAIDALHAMKRGMREALGTEGRASQQVGRCACAG